jgi:hypothetical protein
VIFNGVRLTGGSLFVNESDVNMNELPRGGVIVSLASSAGLGYAPLVGASLTAVIGGGGSIVSLVGNSGSGYRSPVSVAITESGHTGNTAIINATVGLGGTLSFTISNGGTGYTNPTISIPSPTYSNMPVTGVSRLGIGNTTDCGTGLLLDLEVKPSSSVGIGTTLFEISNFKIVRNGYGFRRGDIIKVVGLVTDSRLSSPVSEFTLEILETFNDSFSGWQFGQLDYIDSVKNYQNGNRTRFPLFYRGNLLSFQKNPLNQESQLIDIDSLLIIFINGILQQPGDAYQFSGGTTFTFTTPPRVEDDISIFFYRGSSDDSTITEVKETIKIGDNIQSFSNNNDLDITTTQDIRTVTDIYSSDTIRTNSYSGQGIDSENYKPVSWIKQKTDKNINGSVVYKSRNSLETQIYPTARIVKNFSSAEDTIFTDNALFFNYERDQLSSPDVEFDAIIYSETSEEYEVIKSISSLSGVDGSSGYITGIQTSNGVGTNLALTFTLETPGDLSVGDIIFVFDTKVGSGVTSINNSDSAVIGVGTQFLDNIYYVNSFNSSLGIVTCNVRSNSNIIGISTSGDSVGKYSWGKLTGFTRSTSPISVAVSGYTVDVGLTTFPIIQRRGDGGLRDTGSLGI